MDTDTYIIRGSRGSLTSFQVVSKSLRAHSVDAFSGLRGTGMQI